MESNEYEKRLKELETQIDRLRSLYDQYFRGIEKQAPLVVQKKVERELRELRKIRIRNTATRFKLQMQVQKYTTYMSYWHRILRMLEDGQLKRGPGVMIPVTPQPRAGVAAGESVGAAEGLATGDLSLDIPIDVYDEDDAAIEEDEALPAPAPVPRPAPPTPPAPATPATPATPPLPMPPAHPSSRPPQGQQIRRPSPVTKPGEVRRVQMVPIEERMSTRPVDPQPSLVPYTKKDSPTQSNLAVRGPARPGRMIGAKPSKPATGDANGTDQSRAAPADDPGKGRSR